MKTLVIGTGRREHALALSLTHDPGATEVHAAPGNPGHGRGRDPPRRRPDRRRRGHRVRERHGIDLVVIGPEAPLVAGVADPCATRGIPVFGPGKAAAQLEGSKTFAKRVMDAAGVPTGARSAPARTPRGRGRPRRVRRALRREGRRARRRQGRARHRRPRRSRRARRRCLRRRCSSRSSSPDRRCRCSRQRRRPTCSRFSPRRTTSACSTATRAPTRAAWAPTRRSPGCPTLRRRGDRPSRSRPCASWRGGHPVHRASSTPASS